MNIGLALRKIRHEKGLTLAEVAEKAKISNPYLSMIETGDRGNPNISVVQRLCGVYGVPYAIVAWMGMEEKDIKKGKQHLYKELKPAIDSLILEILK